MRAIIATLAVEGVMAAGAAWASDNVVSLRGANAIPALNQAPMEYKQATMKKGFKRTFKEQPPLIAHEIENTKKFQINLRANGCLDCHDKSTYEEEDAPMAGKSHYVGDDGKEKDDINMSRYFCTQCHVPQADAKPLVENTFVGNVK